MDAECSTARRRVNKYLLTGGAGCGLLPRMPTHSPLHVLGFVAALSALLWWMTRARREADDLPTWAWGQIASLPDPPRPRPRLVYLAGPLSAWPGMPTDAHLALATAAYLRLVEAGVPTYCPHLSAYIPSAETRVSYEDWMTHDLRVLDACSHVALLDGWERSPGAMRERAYALRKGIPVVRVGVLLADEAIG